MLCSICVLVVFLEGVAERGVRGKLRTLFLAKERGLLNNKKKKLRVIQFRLYKKRIYSKFYSSPPTPLRTLMRILLLGFTSRELPIKRVDVQFGKVRRVNINKKNLGSQLFQL